MWFCAYAWVSVVFIATTLSALAQSNIPAKTVLGNAATTPAPASALSVPSTLGIETYISGGKANQKRWLLQPCGGCVTADGSSGLDGLILSPLSDAGVPWYTTGWGYYFSHMGAVTIALDPTSSGQVMETCIGTDGGNQGAGSSQSVLDCFGNNDLVHNSSATGDNTIYWTMNSDLANDFTRIIFDTGPATALEIGSHSNADKARQVCSMFSVSHQNYICANVGPLSIGTGAQAVIGIDGANGDVTVKPYGFNGTGSNSSIALTATVTNINGGLVSGGAVFTVSGCGAGAIIGGSTAGSIVVGNTASPCTFVIGMGAGAAAPHGWVCNADDITTGPTHLTNAAIATTSCTVKGNVVSGDRIQFSAVGY